MKHFIHFLSVLFISLTSCAVKDAVHAKSSSSSDSKEKNYSYHPLDPLPIRVISTEAHLPKEINSTYLKENGNTSVLTNLPDETMRLAIGEITEEGTITFGPAKAGVKGKSYIVILDYIKFNTLSLPIVEKKSGDKIAIQQDYIEMLKSDLKKNKSNHSVFNIESLLLSNDSTSKNSSNKVIECEHTPSTLKTNKNDFLNKVIPIYIGVGVRLTANVTVNEGKVDLGNLFALGTAANNQKISGTLVIQTLGISGESISPIIPMPSEITPSTIQNAILAIGTIKSKIYDEKTIIHPRVVGVNNTLVGDENKINDFISLLLLNPLVFVVR